MTCLRVSLEGLRVGLPMPGPPIKTSFKPDDYYYHSTLAVNLPGIALHGLKASDDGAVFMSERPAVARWYKWVAVEAGYRTDAPGEMTIEQSVPVVLRFPKVISVQLDKGGSRDTSVMLGFTAKNYDPGRFKHGSRYREMTRREAMSAKSSQEYERRAKEYKAKIERYSRAYFTTKGLPPKLLQVYDGYRWRPIREYPKINLSKAMGKRYVLTPERNPLVPTL